MVNYYDEQQENGSSVPLVVGGLAGAAGAGYLANKHWSGAGNTIAADADKLKGTNLGKIKEMKKLISDAGDVTDASLATDIEKLSLESLDSRFSELPKDGDLRKAISNDAGHFDRAKATAYLKDVGKSEAINPAAYESALHNLEVEAGKKGSLGVAVAGEVMTDGKFDAPKAESWLKNNPEHITKNATDGIGEDVAAYKEARVERAKMQNPLPKSFEDTVAKYEGHTVDSAKEIKVADKKPKGFKEWSPERKALHGAERNVQEAGKAYAQQHAEFKVWEASEGAAVGPEFVETQRATMLGKHEAVLHNAVADRHALSHPKSMASQAEGVMGKIKSAGSGKVKIVGAALAGAAVVGGIAHKMFGGAEPSPRVDPASLQMGNQMAMQGQGY